MFLFVFKTKCELKCQNELFFNIIRSVCFDYWEFLTNFLTYFLTIFDDAIWRRTKLQLEFLNGLRFSHLSATRKWQRNRFLNFYRHWLQFSLFEIVAEQRSLKWAQIDRKKVIFLQSNWFFHHFSKKTIVYRLIILRKSNFIETFLCIVIYPFKFFDKVPNKWYFVI